jgi:hypothetical protein
MFAMRFAIRTRTGEAGDRSRQLRTWSVVADRFGYTGSSSEIMKSAAQCEPKDDKNGRDVTKSSALSSPGVLSVCSWMKFKKPESTEDREKERLEGSGLARPIIERN